MKLDEGIIPFSEAWANARIGRLTASKMNKIFVSGQGKDKLVGVGGMTYIHQKIGEILSRMMYDDVPETEDILRGLGNEQFAIQRYSEITGEPVHDSLLFEYNAIACGTTDGQILDYRNEIKAITEAKCPRPYKHQQILAIDAPIELKLIDPQYYHQCQANILFTDSQYADFISYNDDIKIYDLQIRIVRIYPDMAWRKEFSERIEWVADFMNTQLDKILKAPERNLQLRIKDKGDEILKLQKAIENVKNISV